MSRSSPLRSRWSVVVVLLAGGALGACGTNGVRAADPAGKTEPAAADPFAKWEKAIAALEAKDKETPPPQGAVLFAGSSSIRLWDLQKSFGGMPAVNRGFGGSTIPDSTHFAERIILPSKPKTIVFYAGDNDIAGKRTAEQVAEDFRLFAAKVHATLPETRILWVAIKPSVARWKLFETQKAANALVAAQCAKDPRLVYVDVVAPMLGADGQPKAELFVKDGLHLSEAGYAIWTVRVKAALAQE